MALINRAFPSTHFNEQFIDAYVILFTFLPLVFFFEYKVPFILYLALAIGIWRIIEVIVYLGNAYLFDDYRAKMNNEVPRPFGGIRRSIILTLFNYAELILWFAVFYHNAIPNLSKPSIQSCVDAVNFSFVTMSSFGATNVEPPIGASHWLRCSNLS